MRFEDPSVCLRKTLKDDKYVVLRRFEFNPSAEPTGQHGELIKEETLGGDV